MRAARRHRRDGWCPGGLCGAAARPSSWVAIIPSELAPRRAGPCRRAPPDARIITHAARPPLSLLHSVDRTHVLDLAAGATVADVKAAVEARQGVAAASQRVLFGGKPLADAAALSELGVGADATLLIALRLAGGAKKRKKKTYTKPKKAKHVHTKVKLRVLKFYKVDDAGKVQRLRKVCPQCGPGIFMATHFNRVYCGQCHLTYVYEKDGAQA